MTRKLARVLLGPEPGQAGTGDSETEASRVASVILLLAGVSLVAGMIHIRASIDHAEEFPLYTPVFALLAVFQIAWAGIIARGGSRRMLALGCAVNLGVIGLWVASRTVGVPIAAQPWIPEPVGAPDLMATVAESAIVLVTACVLLSLRSPLAQRNLARLAPLLLGVIFVGVMYGLAGGHAH
jgi:hypothetical protein